MSRRLAPLRAALLAVVAVGLMVAGGGVAVALGIGRDDPPASDSVDAGFARDMSRHHLQAVEMANLALERSEDRAVRGLAFDISSTQTNQAGRMQGWLALWGLPPSAGRSMAWLESADSGHAGHADGGHGHAGPGMPGMATEEELAELRSLTGPAFGVQFLRLMIRHHEGGYDMARYAAEHAGEPAVRTLARAMAETQTAETSLMEGMLTDRGGSPLPAP